MTKLSTDDEMAERRATWTEPTTAWHGGDCPVPPNTYVGVIYSDGSWSTCKAKTRSWCHSPGSANIVAYAILKEDVEAAARLRASTPSHASSTDALAALRGPDGDCDINISAVGWLHSLLETVREPSVISAILATTDDPDAIHTMLQECEALERNGLAALVSSSEQGKAREAVIEAARNCISDDRYIDEGGTQRGGTMFRGRTSDALGGALSKLAELEGKAP